MPLYLYACQSCSKEHEVIQKFSDAAVKKCPSCGGKLERQITATSFQLKGSGWYKDGYASPKPEPPKAKEGTQEPGSKAPSAEKNSSKLEDKAAKPASSIHQTAQESGG